MSFERQVKKLKAMDRKIAVKIYKRLCKCLKAKKLIYKKFNKRLNVMLDVYTYFKIFEETHVMFFVSKLPITVDPARRLEMSAAIIHINRKIDDGGFDYNAKIGAITYRQVLSFRHSDIGDGMFEYIVANTREMIDLYQPELAALNDGSISLEEIMAKG